MSTRPVDDAVAVFTELGWPDLRDEQLPTAELGSPEQRRRAKAGCRSGPWEEFVTDTNRPRMVSTLGSIQLGHFAIFAIRVGVDARRAAAVIGPRSTPDDVLLPVLLERGPAFCTQFISRVCTSARRWSTHQPTPLAGVAIRLVTALALDVPDNLEYLIDWSACAQMALAPAGDGSPHWGRIGMTLPSVEVLVARFADHAQAAVAIGAPMTGPLPEALRHGLARGLIGREELTVLAFAGLDAARRPGDRAAWVRFLADDLRVSDTEILDRAESLIPTLATGTPEIIDRLGAVLLAKAPADLLPDLVATILPVVGSRRLRTLVLDTLTARDIPDPAVVQEISDVLAGLEAKAFEPRSLSALTAAWSMTIKPASQSKAPLAEWRATPSVWTVPRFDPGPATPERLTEAVRPLLTSSQETVVTSIDVEHFLSLMVSCAVDDVDATRAALRGVRNTEGPGVRRVTDWCRGIDFSEDYYDRTLTGARDSIVVQRLGQIPCLLSEPSWDDLRIDAADLAGRLDRYVDAGVDAGEADLLLALTRLDPATATPQTVAAIRGCSAGVTRLGADAPAPQIEGEKQRRTLRGLWKRSGTADHAVRGPRVGELAGRWFDNPIREPKMQHHSGFQGWRPEPVVVPEALEQEFGGFVQDLGHRFGFWEFPTWGDVVMTRVGDSYEADPGQGVLLKQLARRGTPLPPGAAINLLAAQRDPHPQAAAEAQQAVLDTFDRGLLRPGVADVRYLDWTDAPQGFAALARALSELTESGLLSVIWPVLDDLVGLAAAAPTVISGTDIVLETIRAWLPSVRAAVDSGAVEPSALELIGVRKLALRTGSGVAVTAAKSLVVLLPAATQPVQPAPVVTAVAPVFRDRDFADLWPAGVGTAPTIDDGAAITLRHDGRMGSVGRLQTQLQFAHWPGRTFALTNNWCYPMLHEGQCGGVEVVAEPDYERDRIWLSWDTESARMELSRLRYLDGDESRIPRRPVRPPLTSSMVVVILTAAHDGETHYVAELARSNLFGADAVSRATPVLLRSPEVNPAKLMEILEKAPATLPALWPVLSESVRFAGDSEDALPRWLNPVLTIALGVAPYLREAVRRDLAPNAAIRWPGLDRIAARRGNSATLAKARELLALAGSGAS